LNFLASEAEGKSGKRDTIFSELRDGQLPPSEKRPQRLIDEANILMVAGGEAITQLLTVVSYHLLDNPVILAKLRVELDTVMLSPDSAVSWSQLEKLPYLVSQAVILLIDAPTYFSRPPSFKKDFVSRPS